jgi:tetratricopeptide (TPR) repeat protein
MEEKHDVRAGSASPLLAWVAGAAALALYLVTLNHWVSLSSLPLVAKVTGWDWVLPIQAPLFYLVTYPFRLLPVAWQPVGLNVFSAVCAAFSLGLLARCVVLLPHDRTHEQRQRERSEFSLLSIPTAWMPPLFAVLVCGLELTFWEHSVVATGEMLDLLVFAYAVRCILEYRVEHRASWLYRFAFVYGLGITNNWSLIGFLPLFISALVWIRGMAFFKFGFLARMLGCGLAGLSLYLLLPVAWAMAHHPAVGFWESLKANLAGQKAMLLEVPGLRSRALVLSLTSILPVIIMGIRWPATFGDTSAAGSAMTNLMFRVIHVTLLTACLWVPFDQKFSPRSLGYGLPFLTFYFLGALSVGYFSGYLLLVFGEERRSKSWRRRSGVAQAMGKLIVGLVWVAFIAVPSALAYKNFKAVRQTGESALARLADAFADGLPSSSSIVLSDDPYTLLLLEARTSRSPGVARHVLVHTQSIKNSNYNLQLSKRYPDRWPAALVKPGELFDDNTLLNRMLDLAKTNAIYYLHPSFGFYFERFESKPKGMVWELVASPTNRTALPVLSPGDLAASQTLWTKQEEGIAALNRSPESKDAAFVRGFYSRALNWWGVTLQRNQKTAEAAKYFEAAASLNTNNVCSLANRDFNRALRTGGGDTDDLAKQIDERLAGYRPWDLMPEYGPVDYPKTCLQVGDIFANRGMYRQAEVEIRRARELTPGDPLPELALASLYLQSGHTGDAIRHARSTRSEKTPKLTESIATELIRIEANAEYSKKDAAAAEKVLLDGIASYPRSLGIHDTLVQLYAQQQRYADALAVLDKLDKIAPDNTQVQMNRVTVYFNTKDFTKAHALLDQIIQRDTKNIPAQLYKTFIYVQQLDYDKATPLVDAVLRVDPSNVEALTYRGVIAIEKKDYAAAIAPLDRVLKANPDDWNALRNRAIAYLQMGNLPKAKQDYALLVRLMPRYYVAYYGLAEIAYRQKDTEAAIRNYGHYLKNFPATSTPELDQEKKLVADRLNELQGARR